MTKAPPATPITQICAWDGSCCHAAVSAQNGGYRTRRERLLVTVCNLTPVSG